MNLAQDVIMADTIDWVVITKYGKQIGAVGFIGDTAVVVTAFYQNLDGNQDGKVSIGEWIAGKLSPFNLKGKAIVEVAMQARIEDDVALRDPTFQTMAANLFTHFAKGLISQGIYAVYFGQAISAIAAPIAGRMASNMVAQFAIRKGMETTVKTAYNAATQ